jgi:hypothetical protein
MPRKRLQEKDTRQADLFATVPNHDISNWTVDKVKTRLPNVRVQLGKELVAATTAGRLNPTCTVEVMTYLNPKLAIDYQRLEYDWKLVVEALNKNQPLEIKTKTKTKAHR